MKKNYVTKLGALALALTLITTCMMGSTLARYVSEVTGTGTAKIAAWNIKMTKGTSELTKDFDLEFEKTKDENNFVSADKMAPGDSGSFKIAIEDSGSEVAYTYAIAINTKNLTDNNVDIKFYTDADYKTLWKDIPDTKVEAGAAASKVEKTIYWRWLGEETDATKAVAQNEKDTGAGAAATAEGLKFTVTMTAKQLLPGETVAAPTT